MAAPVHLDLPTWEDETISNVFNVTLKVFSVSRRAAVLQFDGVCRKRLRRGPHMKWCG